MHEDASPKPPASESRPRQPAGRLRQRLPALGAASAGPVASLGRGGLCPGQGRRQAHSARHRRGLVPLVPRHGSRVLRESGDRPAHQRAFCRRQGRSRRAARCGRALPGCGLGHQRPGRLAADGLSHSRWPALLRRHLLSARRPLWPAGLSARARGHGPGLARAAR